MLCLRERVRNAVEQSGISAGSVLRSGVCGDHLPTDPDVLRAVVLEPPEVVGNTLHYEFTPHVGLDRLRRVHCRRGARVIQGVNR